jgi:phosphohistidine phosphatase
MRQLLLLRHAKSSWDDVAQSDHARPLNPRGRAAAKAMREVIRNLGLTPDVILVSSARRTLQTLDALAPWDETPIIEMMDGLYLASPAKILGILGGVSETVRSLMVVGHNPGLHELAMTLTGAHGLASNGPSAQNSTAKLLAEGFPAGALVEFSIPQSWQAVQASGGEGGGRLVRFIRPRDLVDD